MFPTDALLWHTRGGTGLTRMPFFEVMRVSAEVAWVDGNNTVHIDLHSEVFAAFHVNPNEFDPLVWPVTNDWFRIKLVAAGARYLSDIYGLDLIGSVRPSEISLEPAGTIAKAVPVAWERIDFMRATGHRVSNVMLPSDLARVRGDDPLTVAVSYGSSAASAHEYERRMYDIKSADEPLPLKMEKLANAVLSFADEVDAARVRHRVERESAPSESRSHRQGAARRPSRSRAVASYRVDEARDSVSQLRASLSDSAQRWIHTSEVVAAQLAKVPNLDWTGPIISLCKAFELETVDRVIKPLCRDLGSHAISSTDLEDNDIGRVAKFCAGKTTAPPELGTITHFLRTAAHSKRRVETSDTLRAFRDLVARWGSDWLLDDNGAISAIPELTTRFRNPAAHTGEFHHHDYLSCQDFVTGPSGVLWKLLVATTPV